MGKKPLVVSRFMSKDMEFAGNFLLKELKKRDLDVKAALWFFYTDFSTWKYIVVIDDFELKGPAYVYNIVSQINRNHKSSKYHAIPLDLVEAKGKNSLIYKVLIHTLHVEQGSPVRFSNMQVNGIEIPDSVIYQML